MKNIPENTFIYVDDLFIKTKLKDKQKFNYYLYQLQDKGFIGIGNCQDIILTKSYIFLSEYLKQKRNTFIYRWLPILISTIALIKSFSPELVLLWKLLMQK